MDRKEKVIEGLYLWLLALALLVCVIRLAKADQVADSVAMWLPSAYAMNRAVPSPSPIPEVPPSPKPVISPSPRVPGIHFSPVKGYNKEQLEVLAISERLANELLHSQCFDGFMINRGLIQTNGRSNRQVIDHLKSAKFTAPLQMYNDPGSGVIGYRQPPYPIIYTNLDYLEGSTACARASNLTHEWTHLLNYGHDYNRTERRNFSVPYSMNFAFLRCCTCKPKTIKDCRVLP